jgi:hypothetical protein
VLLPFLSVGPEPAMIKATGILLIFFGVVNVPNMSPVFVCKTRGVSTKAESLFGAATIIVLMKKEKIEVKISLNMLIVLALLQGTGIVI